MTGIQEVSLEQMLKAREERVERHHELILRYGMPLVSFTVNMPGKYKKTPASKTIFHAGYQELMDRLLENGTAPVYCETCSHVTGYEAYIAATPDEIPLKELVLCIEQEHPLGRLFDFDVIGRNGIAVSRRVLDHPGRSCLICGKDAHACARSRAHPVEELLAEIDIIVEAYRKQNAVMAYR